MSSTEVPAPSCSTTSRAAEQLRSLGQGDAEVDGSAGGHGPRRGPGIFCFWNLNMRPSLSERFPWHGKREGAIPSLVSRDQGLLRQVRRPVYLQVLPADRFFAGGTGEACQMFPA